ncbi:MAG: TlpA family protein disulfide reductase [Deferribacteraceae bacterium]|jgi:thiol-disulfide isomerase/thioredoxin|nr:TlpA family protein disulfide reductase [Deferribacteraceae bacterium]
MKTLTLVLIALTFLTFGACKKEPVVSSSEIVTLNSVDQLKVDNKGKVLILNVFATWCPPCEEETPALVRFYNENKLPVELIGLSIDTDLAAVVKFREDYKITYPIYHIPDSVRYKLMANKVPTTLIYAPDGSFYTVLMGAIDETILENIVKELI